MANKQAVVNTTEGEFVIDLQPGLAPNHVGYFMKLAREGAYDRTAFHRIVKHGIIQGGDPLSKDPAKSKAYGTGGHDITLPSSNPSVAVTLHYTTFAQLTDDINDARVYGGIHFRFDQDGGSRMGRHVGSYILRNQLRPAQGEE